MGSIAGAVWEGLKVALAWIVGYNKPDVTEGREMDNEKHKKDEFNRDLARGEEGLDDVRRKLGG